MSYIKMTDKRATYVDIDYTLIDWDVPSDEDGLILVGPDGDSFKVKPIDEHIKLIHELRAVGRQIVVWSQGGADHAERVIKLLQLEHLVDLIVSKPNEYVDDMPFEQQNIRRIYKV